MISQEDLLNMIATDALESLAKMNWRTMPKITFQTSPLVWIIVAGEKPKDGNATRIDGGFIGRFSTFLHESNIIPSRAAGLTASGRLSLGFHPDDAPQILAWLAAHNATQEPQDFVFSSEHWKEVK